MTLLFAHSRPPVLLISGLAALTLGLPSSMDRVQAQSADVKLFPPPEVQVLLEHASTGASEALAASIGVTEIGGKSRIGAPGHAGSPRLRDVPVGVTSNDENEPTVVASPTDLKYLVAGSHSFPIGGRNRCAVYTSNDGGAGWSTGAPMPQLTATSSCSDPVLAYAPAAVEAEIRAAFEKSRKVRGLGADARALADQAIMETVIYIAPAKALPIPD